MLQALAAVGEGVAGRPLLVQLEVSPTVFPSTCPLIFPPSRLFPWKCLTLAGTVGVPRIEEGPQAGFVTPRIKSPRAN